MPECWKTGRCGTQRLALRRVGSPHPCWREAQARHVELVIAPTPQAIEELVRESQGTNAILHVTC